MTYVVQGIVPDSPVHVPGKPSIRIALFDTNGDPVLGGGGSVIHRKFVAASIAIPDGNNQTIDTLSFELEEESLVHLWAAADHSDPPASHQMSSHLNADKIIVDAGNNTGSVFRYAIQESSTGVPAWSSMGATSAAALKQMASGVARILPAGTYDWKLTTSRSGSGGTIANRLLVAKIESGAVTDQ